MKKIVSLIVVIVVLAWTWSAMHSEPKISFETHAGIQGKLSELIKNTISSRRPNAKDIVITKIWTEELSETKVKAEFAYSFKEVNAETNEETSQTITGEAVLHRELSETTGDDRWVLQSVDTTNDSVTFTEGEVITSGGTTTTDTPATDSTQAPAASAPNAEPNTTPSTVNQ